MFDHLRHRFLKSVLSIEIRDAHRYLRFLHHAELRLIHYISNIIPAVLLDSFFVKQERYFGFLYHTERDRVINKFDWLVERRRRTPPQVPPIKYFCTVPPMEKINNYKFKLRSHSESPHSAPNPAIFSFHPPSPPSPDSSFFILLNPASFTPPNAPSFISPSSNWIVNLSSVAVPDEVQGILQLGEVFCLPVSRNIRSSLTFEFIKHVQKNIAKLHPEMMGSVRNGSVQTLNKYLSTFPLSQ